MSHRKRPPKTSGSASPPSEGGKLKEKSKASEHPEGNAVTALKSTSRKVSPLSVTQGFPPTDKKTTSKDKLNFYAQSILGLKLSQKLEADSILNGSGSSILERIYQRDVGLLAVAYPDRLARFGFPLIEWICQQSECKLVVLNESKLSPHEELVQDILSILHCFSTRLYGLRKYQKQTEKALQEESPQQVEEGKTKQCLEDQGLSI